MLSGSCPVVAFEVSGRTVYTSLKTDFDKGKCKDIKSGLEVEVKGMLMSDGRIRADKVSFDDKDDDK